MDKSSVFAASENSYSVSIGLMSTRTTIRVQEKVMLTHSCPSTLCFSYKYLDFEVILITGEKIR